MVAEESEKYTEDEEEEKETLKTIRPVVVVGGNGEGMDLRAVGRLNVDAAVAGGEEGRGRLGMVMMEVRRLIARWNNFTNLGAGKLIWTTFTTDFTNSVI